MSERDEGFAERLRGLIGRRTVKEIAAEWGIPATTLQSYLSRGTQPTLPGLRRLARAAGVSESWLAGGVGGAERSDRERALDAVEYGARVAAEAASRFALSETQLRSVQSGLVGAVLGGAAVHQIREPSPADEGAEAAFVFVRRLTAKASAGRGRFNDVYGDGALAFRRDWIANTLRARSDALVTISVEGDSMSPGFNDGDVVLVNRDRTDVAAGGVFVFGVEDALFMKRLQRQPRGGVLAISDNRAYEPFTLPPDARIEGQVVWRGGRV